MRYFMEHGDGFPDGRKKNPTKNSLKQKCSFHFTATAFLNGNDVIEKNVNISDFQIFEVMKKRKNRNSNTDRNSDWEIYQLIF